MCQKQILGHQIFSISPNSELWFDFFDAEQSVWTNSSVVNYISELFSSNSSWPGSELFYD